MKSTGAPSRPSAAQADTIAEVEHEFGGPDVGDEFGPDVVSEVMPGVGSEVVTDVVPAGIRDEETFDIDGSVLDGIEQQLADVERALAMLDDGTYGQCEACGRVIDDEMLARMPTARYCSEHLPFSLR